MADYTITYFDIRGLAELCRLTFAAAGQSFKDNRLEFSVNADGSFNKGDWEQRKASAPYGQVPLLTLGCGTVIAQSAAITRFAAARFGLNGANDVEAALIDGAFEAVTDIRKAYFAGKSDAAKSATFWESGLGASVALLEKNVAGETFFAKSNKLSYADLAIYYLLFVFGTENAASVEAVLKANPKVAKISEAVANDAKVAAYLAARKQTPF